MNSNAIVFQHGQLTLSGKKIFSDLCVEIPAEEFVCLIGPSGCGKSSLLRLIARLIELDSSKQEHLPKSVGFVFQDARLLPWLTVKENMALSFGEKNSPDQMLQVLGLAHAADLFPHQISGGMKQRVAIGRALLKKPSVLLLDEPFTALDEPTREDLQIRLYELWSLHKMTVVFVTHSPSEAAFLSHRTLVMNKNGGGWQADLAGVRGERNFQRRLDPQVLSFQQKLSQLLRLNQEALV